MTGIVTTFKAIPPTWKAVTTLGVAILFGALASGWIGLPGQVAGHGARITTLENHQTTNENEHQQILSTLNILLCNNNPNKSWDQCQLEYGQRPR